MPRILNARPDAPDFRDRMYIPTLRVLRRSLNAEPFNDDEQTQLIKEQGDSEACCGYALASMVERLGFAAKAANNEWPSPVPISPWMLFHYARRYDDIPGEAPEKGSTGRGAMKAWYMNGACKSNMWKDMDPPPDNAPWQEDAFSRPLGAYFRVNHSEIADMHAALNETGVIYATAMIHDGWIREHAGVIELSQAPQLLGGHAFLIVGYDQNGFLIQNSWGADWGNRGFAHLTYPDWSEHALDAWIGQLGVNVSGHAQNIANGLDFNRLSTAAVPDPGSLLSSNSAVTTQLINPYIVDLQNNGLLSDTGKYHTNESDVELLLTRYLDSALDQWKLNSNEPINVALYAHGGLTDEDGAFELAKVWVPQLFANKIFPIFFMWETGKLETLQDIWQDWLAKQSAAASFPFLNQLSNFWNDRMESILSAPGTAMWNEMKKNAYEASANDAGGVWKLHEIFENKVSQQIRSRMRFHLIGHSAGSVFHAYLAQKLIDAGLKIDTVYFMAPGITTELFDLTMRPLFDKGSIKRYVQFELNEQAEEQDNCYPLPYTHSLLYLVANAFEKQRPTSILGMKRYFDQYAAGANMPWSQTVVCPTPPDIVTGLRSNNSRHGGFGSDKATVNSIIQDILRAQGRPPAAAAQPVVAGKS